MKTWQEVIEILGDVPMEFVSYCKYSFYFSGTKDGYKIEAKIGGGATEIYRFELKADEYILLKDGDWSEITVFEGKDEIFYEEVMF